MMLHNKKMKHVTMLCNTVYMYNTIHTIYVRAAQYTAMAVTAGEMQLNNTCQRRLFPN